MSLSKVGLKVGSQWPQFIGFLWHAQTGMCLVYSQHSKVPAATSLAKSNAKPVALHRALPLLPSAGTWTSFLCGSCTGLRATLRTFSLLY